MGAAKSGVCLFNAIWVRLRWWGKLLVLSFICLENHQRGYRGHKPFVCRARVKNMVLHDRHVPNCDCPMPVRAACRLRVLNRKKKYEVDLGCHKMLLTRVRLQMVLLLALHIALYSV